MDIEMMDIAIVGAELAETSSSRLDEGFLWLVGTEGEAVHPSPYTTTIRFERNLLKYPAPIQNISMTDQKRK